MRRERLFLRTSKCEFAKSRVDLCGFVVGEGKIDVQESKVKVVREWPVPKNISDVRAFLGLCNFYHRHVSEFADAIGPLTALLKKGRSWSWGVVEQTSFERIKEMMCSAKSLWAPRADREFHIYTDASNEAVGSTLGQLDDDGVLRPVAFRSRRLQAAERNYPTHEKEMLAAVDAVKHFRYLIGGMQVVVWTDHRALTWFTRMAKFVCRLHWLNR